MEYLPKNFRNGMLSEKKPEKKKITMADLANLKNMMKRFERNAGPEPAPPEKQRCERRGSNSSSTSLNHSVHSVQSSANLDGLNASLARQRIMRSNSSRDLTEVLDRSNDPLGSQSMHGSTSTVLSALQRSRMFGTKALPDSNQLDTIGASTHGRVESSDAVTLYSSASLMGRRGTSQTRSQSDHSTLVPSPRNVHTLYKEKTDSLFSSSALILRRNKSNDDVSVMSTGGGKRRTRRLSIGSKTAESTPESESPAANMGAVSATLAELRAGLGLPSPYEKPKAANSAEQGVAASEHGTSITPNHVTGDSQLLSGGSGTLADLRRSVVSRRALLLTGGGDSALDDARPMMIKRGIGRRGSVGGMALPPTTLCPQVKKRPSRSRSLQRRPSEDKSVNGDDGSVSSKKEKSPKSPEKEGRGRSQSVQRSSKSTDKTKSSEIKSPIKSPKSKIKSPIKSPKIKSPEKQARGRSQSVQRGSKSTESPKLSSEKKGLGRPSKSSDVPPETKTSERKGRGRSQSAHRSSKSSDKPTGAVPPETKAPDKKGRGRSKSTQRRVSKTPKEQARRKHEFNEFETDQAAKLEAEAAEVAEQQAAEKKAAGSALGRRRERSQSMSHRQPSLLGLGEATSTPGAATQPLAANSSNETEKSKVDSTGVSAFGTALDSGGFPTASADFTATPAWDDDPWAEEGGQFNPNVPTVTTKVETTPTVPATINFGDPSDLFGCESTGSGLGSTSSHGSRGGGSAGLGSTSNHSRGGGSSDLGSCSGHSRGSGSGRRKSLTHMDSSFDAGSVAGRSRNNLQGVRRSHVGGAIGPGIGQTVLAVPATKRRSSMTGGFDHSDVKSVGFDEDPPATSVAPPSAIVFAGKKQVSTKKLDDVTDWSRVADSSQGPAASPGQRGPPPTAAALFAEKLAAAKRFDQARGGSQGLQKADSGRGADSASVADKFKAAKKQDEIKSSADSGLNLDSFQRKHSNAPQPTTASAFAAKLQAARHDDSRSVSCTVNTESTASMSSGSKSSKVPRRQSMELACQPDKTAKKMNRSRRSSLV